MRDPQFSFNVFASGERTDDVKLDAEYNAQSTEASTILVDTFQPLFCHFDLGVDVSNGSAIWSEILQNLIPS